jgi:hypothetical protein
MFKTKYDSLRFTGKIQRRVLLKLYHGRYNEHKVCDNNWNQHV